MTHPFARSYDRVVALLRGDYRRLLKQYKQPDEELRATLQEIRVVIACIARFDKLQDLPDLPERHKLEREAELGHEREKRDATKW